MKARNAVRLDETGNINTVPLEKELNHALDFDIKYKQTDNMKKKAVKVAASYDEFKNMVACAHLKTLSRKEVESLGDSKKGWQKKNIKNSVEAKILIDEQKQENLRNGKSVLKSKFNIPRTSNELDRDWRRLQDSEKISYLRRIGLEHIESLLRIDADTQLVEQILETIMISTSIPNSNSEDQNADTQINTNIDNINTANKLDILELVQWLNSITRYSRFGLTIQFVSTNLKSKIKNILRELSATERINEGGINSLSKNEINFDEIIGKYSA